MKNLGETRGRSGAPLTLVATVAASESVDHFHLLATGTLANLAPVVTSTANRFAELGARRNQFDLSTYRARLVSGRIFPIAVQTNRFAGLSVFVNSFFLPTRAANALHNLTSFELWVGFCLKKSEIRLPDLKMYPTLLFALRQDQNEKRNPYGISTNAPPLFWKLEARAQRRGVQRGNSAAPERFRRAKRRRSVPFKMCSSRVI
jgi:hypothetical protein